MNQQPEAPPTEQVYGIAKKMSLELDKLPLHTHGAVISMMTTMAKHREATLRQEQEAKMQAAQDAAMADALKAHADAQVKRENQIADQIRREADQANPKGEDTGKAPRLSIVLDKQAEDIGQRNAALMSGPSNPRFADSQLESVRKAVFHDWTSAIREVRSLCESFPDLYPTDFHGAVSETVLINALQYIRQGHAKDHAMSDSEIEHVVRIALENNPDATEDSFRLSPEADRCKAAFRKIKGLVLA